jgi:glycosyltransferase involved in cell wall biosynthesis
LKIGLIVPGGFDRGDRIITALQNLSIELGTRHEVHVFAADGPSGPGRYPLAGAMVHQLDGGPVVGHDLGRLPRRARLGRLAWRLFREIESARSTGTFDLLHAFWAGDTGLLATLISRWLGVPVVLSVGGGEAVWLPEIGYGGAGSAWGRARTRVALELAHAITVGSQFAARYLQTSVATRALIVPLGVRCETFAETPSRPAGPPWRLVQVADLNPVKDQETLLQALPRIVARVGDISLDCIGEDTMGGRLKQTADALGVGGRVRFHGFLAQRRLPTFYRNAHLHVVSSRYESQGVAILEAAAAGLPTVGTAVGLLPAMAPLAARCVAPGDAVALADAISESLLDEGGRQVMGAAAQRWALDHDAGWTAREFERVYTEVLESPDSQFPRPGQRLWVLGSRRRMNRRASASSQE